MEGAMRGNARELTPPVRQPDHLQPRNGMNHQFLNRIDGSYRFKARDEDDNEVRDV
jgi:hypothetical protein